MQRMLLLGKTASSVWRSLSQPNSLVSASCCLGLHLLAPDTFSFAGCVTLGGTVVSSSAFRLEMNCSLLSELSLSVSSSELDELASSSVWAKGPRLFSRFGGLFPLLAARLLLLATLRCVGELEEEWLRVRFLRGACLGG